MNDKKIDIDLDSITPQQDFVMQRMATMVREVLTVVEAAVPEGQQYTSMRRLLNAAMYNSRNDIIKELS
tara:strand:+ start:3533 stop:3739 length:207 start_codon:yes stop_codon:yes gene_type:complete